MSTIFAGPLFMSTSRTSMAQFDVECRQGTLAVTMPSMTVTLSGA
jgi:hypothetical protein